MFRIPYDENASVAKQNLQGSSYAYNVYNIYSIGRRSVQTSNYGDVAALLQIHAAHIPPSQLQSLGKSIENDHVVNMGFNGGFAACDASLMRCMLFSYECTIKGSNGGLMGWSVRINLCINRFVIFHIGYEVHLLNHWQFSASFFDSSTIHCALSSSTASLPPRLSFQFLVHNTHVMSAILDTVQ